jgi:hypothetical protein
MSNFMFIISITVTKKICSEITVAPASTASEEEEAAASFIFILAGVYEFLLPIGIFQQNCSF